MTRADMIESRITQSFSGQHERIYPDGGFESDVLPHHLITRRMFAYLSCWIEQGATVVGSLLPSFRPIILL